MKIERTFSKEKILELYLNEIYLGIGAYGVAAASLLYFDKSVHELTVAEAAYLAALPKAPEQLPSVPPARARHRAPQLRASTAWLEDRYITAQEAEKAKKEPLKITPRADRRAHLRGGIFRRGSPPLHQRQLQREEALRGRPLGAHHARSEAAGAGAQGADRRLRELRRAAGLSRRASASSTWRATGASSSPRSRRCPTSRRGGSRSCSRSATRRRASASSRRASRAAPSSRSARPAPSRSTA